MTAHIGFIGLGKTRGLKPEWDRSLFSVAHQRDDHRHIDGEVLILCGKHFLLVFSEEPKHEGLVNFFISITGHLDIQP